MKRIILTIFNIIAIVILFFRVSVKPIYSSTSSVTVSLEVDDGTPTFAPTIIPTATSVPVINFNSSPPVCNSAQPQGSPWLYAAVPQDTNKIKIYFTQIQPPIDKYVLEYGTKSGEYLYSVQDMGINEQNQMSFEVKSLSTNTLYFFRIRGGNGCATGQWSNELSAKTKNLINFNQLDITESALDVISGENTDKTTHTTLYNFSKNSESGQKLENAENYALKVKIIDLNNKPVEGAKITMYSDIQIRFTDKNGEAVFEKVEPGNHRILISYNDYEGQEYINVTGSSNELALGLTINAKPPSLTTYIYPIIGIISLTTILIFFYLKQKRLRT